MLSGKQIKLTVLVEVVRVVGGGRLVGAVARNVSQFAAVVAFLLARFTSVWTLA